jgi:transposase InsO family protein
MKNNGIAGVKLRRRVKTTISEPSDRKVPDLVKRDFTAPAPNLKHVGDIKCRRRHLMSYADIRTMPTNAPGRRS